MWPLMVVKVYVKLLFIVRNCAANIGWYFL
jgi:hypothetical protein